jgi:hypothetical protein
MITTELPNGRVFLHNGDFSGDLEINVHPAELEELDTEDGTQLFRLAIPFEDIKAIVADYVRRVRTVELEQMSDDQVLGVGE